LSIASAGALGVGASAEIACAMEAMNPLRRQEEVNLRLDATAVTVRQRDRGAAVASAQRALQVCRETGVVAAEIEALGLLAVAFADAGEGSQALEAAQAAKKWLRAFLREN
jgi:hypothetical protein